MLKEGFFSRERKTHHNRWPELFTVVSNAETHASVSRRGEFVLNKVHGCVDAWRVAVGADPEEATQAIIIRWSQLLDWRQDTWARDLFRDRARRNVLFLIGFSGLDPVIHSTLRAVMKEVAGQMRLAGPSRLRAVDVDPHKLTLKMLLQAGRGDCHDVQVLQVHNDLGIDLAATLLALQLRLVNERLLGFANNNGIDPHLPSDRRALHRRLSISAPAMLRWTWAVMAHRYGTTGFTGLRELGDDYYVPLCAEPERTLRAFAVRDRLASLYRVAAESDKYTAVGSFLPVPRVGKAFMPLGLFGHEVSALADDSRGLTDIARMLTSPAGAMDRVVAGLDSHRVLRAFSLETGAEVRL